MHDILGDASCWIIFFAYCGHIFKNILGGCSMALYRTICVKKASGIAANTSRPQKIMVQILSTEFVFFIVLLGLTFSGYLMSGTGGAC